MIYDLYKKEFTLDGEHHKIRVKRKSSFYENEKSDFFLEINNCDLLPGDIVYLKQDDYVPCDCLILEGECIINENSLNGNLDVSKKKALENKNEKFNYKKNKIHILYHGMKIVKTISRLNEGFITVLCINTGANTFKANQYSNILYLFERKDEYKSMYTILGQGRQITIYLILILLTLTTIFGVAYYFLLDVYLDFKNKEIVSLFYKALTRIICKSIMPVFFLTNSIIYFVGIFHLKKEKIFCFEKSKLVTPGKIDTIFIGKTGILCENYFEIKGYHPIHINQGKLNNISYITYSPNQCKEMNSQLLKHYQNYLLKKNKKINSNLAPRPALKIDRTQLIITKKKSRKRRKYNFFFGVSFKL